MKVIKISAIWCPSCIIMNNIFNKIKKNYNYNIIEYDYDFDEDTITQYNVGSKLPVIIIFDKKDNEVERIIGEKSTEEILNILKIYDGR